MIKKKYDRLLRSGLVTETGLEDAAKDARESGGYIEEVLLGMGVPKHEILLGLSEYYNLPFVEYDEELVISSQVTRGLDLERLKDALWIPVSVVDGEAEVIAYEPDSQDTIDDVRKTLGVQTIRFTVSLPWDVVRIIENHQDLNPDFRPCAGRTPLAKTRTFLANRRSLYACYRTYLAKGRTGLAFLRTGLSFITIGILLFRIFGWSYLAVLGAALLGSGLLMAVDGILWYLPARRVGAKRLDCRLTGATWGTTQLKVESPDGEPRFVRTPPVEGAEEQRKSWRDLSPVMRRRFLASDRTDLAEERTVLACLRTVMAKARTGLAFTRTGIAFAGLGIGFLRQFHSIPWVAYGWVLIAAGSLMTAEGIYWYLPGRHAGSEGDKAVKEAGKKATIWDAVFPPKHSLPVPSAPPLDLRKGSAPGVWATTGVALERTVLADRRNVMARLRTVMARSRTGMAFIRTGMSISAVGLGLLVYFGAAKSGWTVFDAMLMLTGFVFIADGLYWHMPAEKARRQFPYCYGDMEITIPDYGRITRDWRRAVFSGGEDD